MPPSPTLRSSLGKKRKNRMQRRKSPVLELGCKYVLDGHRHVIDAGLSEEISTEVQNQMEKIQDGELEQFRDLSRLLDMEMKFVEGWLDTLREIKEDWPAK
jgi:hypothetical protein